MTCVCSLSGTRSNGPSAPTPALLIHTSIRWNASIALWASRSTWRGWLTSVGTASARAPAWRQAAATSFRRCPRRAARTTVAPCSASASAVPLPKPLDAPVMTTTLPATPVVMAPHGRNRRADEPLGLERGHLRLQLFHQVGEATGLHEAGELGAIVAEKAGGADGYVDHAPAAGIPAGDQGLPPRPVRLPGPHRSAPRRP